MPCPKVEDRIVLDDSPIILEKTDALGVHGFPTILQDSIALQEGVDPVKLGLTKPGKKDAYRQCGDPGKPWIEGGTGTFKISTKE